MPTQLLASFTNAPEAQVGQLWSALETGGYMFSENLSNYLRIQVQARCRFRQFCELPEQSASSAKGRGDVFTWNIYKDLPAPAAGTHEIAQGLVGELEEWTQGTPDTLTSMPTTRLLITQGTCTVLEFGHAVPYSGVLDDLSAHPVREVIKKALERNAAQTLDTVAHAQFDNAQLTAVPVSGTSDTDILFETAGTPTVTNNRAMTARHVRAIAIQMRERNIPSHAHGDYYCVARPLTFNNVETDLESVQQYTETGFGRVTNGEKGRYAGVRFVEQTNIASESWTNGASDAAYFFGEDVVNECCVVPEEIRGKIPDDYGRGKGVAWYYVGNFALTRPTTELADQRVVKWDSMAP